eukprot:11623-Heterococcus_DN1.PRE.1
MLAVAAVAVVAVLLLDVESCHNYSSSMHALCTQSSGKQPSAQQHLKSYKYHKCPNLVTLIERLNQFGALWPTCKHYSQGPIYHCLQQQRVLLLVYSCYYCCYHRRLSQAMLAAAESVSTGMTPLLPSYLHTHNSAVVVAVTSVSRQLHNQ